MDNDSRRNFLRLGIIGLGSAFLLDSCAGNQPAGSQNGATPASAPAGNGDDEDESNPPDEKEVTAVEDLMREHGVLRRALLIYAEGALLLRKDPASLPPDALQKTAKIFRSFGEDYHEKQLEETYLFPLIKQKNKDPEVAKYPDILIAQHQRGREITEYILSATNSKIDSKAAQLADALEGFARMYQNHAAREDTIVFPAWKALVTSDEYGQLNDTFENIEQQQFGDDGFEDAVSQISEIEESLGLSDISIFTLPPIH